MAKRILILDDEELIIRTLARVLEKSRFEVTVVKSGEDALAVLQEEEMDLVISDIRMPGVNGLEAMRRMSRARQESGRRKVPIIFITGYADPDLENQAKALDPVAYIYKPFDLDDLMTEIKKALGG